MVVFVEKLLIFNWELCPFYVIINNFNELLQIRRSQTCMHCFKNGSLLIHLKKNLLAKLVYTCANTKKNVQPINACLMKYSMLSFFFQKTRLIFNPFSTSNGLSNNIRIELYLNKTPNKPCLNDGRTSFFNKRRETYEVCIHLQICKATKQYSWV